LSKTRELIILPKVNQSQLTKFLPQLEDEGIKTIYLDPKKIGKKKTKTQHQNHQPKKHNNKQQIKYYQMLPQYLQLTSQLPTIEEYLKLNLL
jgi:hypothetical protein